VVAREDSAWVLEAREDTRLGEVLLRVAPSKRASWACPICLKPAPVYDLRCDEWRDIDDSELRTVVVRARVPRVKCGEHGIRKIQVPWARSRSPFTTSFEGWALECVGNGGPSTTARNLRISRNDLAGIVKRATESTHPTNLPVGVPPSVAARQLGVGVDEVYGSVLAGKLRAVRRRGAPRVLGILGMELLIAEQEHQRSRQWARRIVTATLRAEGRMCGNCECWLGKSVRGKMALCSECQRIAHSLRQRRYRRRQRA
jgi:transposase